MMNATQPAGIFGPLGWRRSMNEASIQHYCRLVAQLVRNRNEMIHLSGNVYTTAFYSAANFSQMTRRVAQKVMRQNPGFPRQVVDAVENEL